METVRLPAELIIHHVFLKKRSIVAEVGRGADAGRGAGGEWQPAMEKGDRCSLHSSAASADLLL